MPRVHPLQAIRDLANAALVPLVEMSGEFEALYSPTGRSVGTNEAGTAEDLPLPPYAPARPGKLLLLVSPQMGMGSGDEIRRALRAGLDATEVNGWRVDEIRNRRGFGWMTLTPFVLYMYVKSLGGGRVLRMGSRPELGSARCCRGRGLRPMPKVRDAIRLVEKEGWSLVRVRGSHRQFRHPEKPGTVTIAGKPGDDLALGTWASILKQAGLKK